MRNTTAVCFDSARRGIALALCLALAVSGCAFQHVDVQAVPLGRAQSFTTPVKAHLDDGSTVVFKDGVAIRDGALQGHGMLYALSGAPATAVESIPLDRVAALESFRTETSRPLASALVTVLAGSAALVGVAWAVVAIFGSCPTVYSHGADGLELEAEMFSSSIAPLLEARDLVRLNAQADDSGAVSLEVRNEAMETHYINHLQLLEVVHDPGVLVAPGPDDRQYMAAAPRPFAQAVDRGGRDVSTVLARADGSAFEADPDLLASADSGDLEDWIDLTAPAGDGTEAAVVFRLKNSLLSTVLFYDVMLAAAGPRALSWLASDLDHISTAVGLGRWVRRRLGMRVSVWQDGAYREVARIPDAGPIAWKDVAVVVPVPPGEKTLRVRLSFTPDLWRIDRVALARSLGPAEGRPVPAVSVTDRNGGRDPEALASILHPDERYLQTTPGQRFTVAFAAGPCPPGKERTFLLSSQGYYTEWIRGKWLKAGLSGEAFTPSDASLRTALRRWREVRSSMETDFETHRVPVL
jgi:hypothetical protein